MDELTTTRDDARHGLTKPVPTVGRRMFDAIGAVLTPLSEATETALEPIALERPDEYLVIATDDEPRNFRFTFETLTTDQHNHGVSRGRVRTLPDGRPAYPKFNLPSLSAKELLDRIPERSLKKDSSDWLVGASDFTALVVSYSWPVDNVIFVDDLARETFKYLLARFAAQSRRAEMAARFKIEKRPPVLPADWVEHPDLPLSEYQKAACLFSMGYDGTALFMDRGTGKTPTVIQRVCMGAIRARRADKPMYRALVVCPNQVRANWQAEFARFCVAPGKVTVLRGTQTERVRTLTLAVRSDQDSWFSVVVVGYGVAINMAKILTAIKWDLGVFDESHFFKDVSTKRWKELARPLRDSMIQRLILTGTPIGNSMMDLWTQLEALGEGSSGFVTYKGYRAMHGVFAEMHGHDGTGVQRLTDVKNVPLMQERLARLSFSITKDEAGLSLPDKVYDVIEVEMGARAWAIYDRIAAEIAAAVEAKMASGEDASLVIANALSSMLRLAQITSGFVSWDPVVDPETLEVRGARRIEQLATPNPKVEALIEILTAEDRDPLGKCVVWACFVPDILAICEGLRKAGIRHGTYYGATPEKMRAENVKFFNSDPGFKVLVANAQSAGEGLNLLGYDPSRPEESKTYCDLEVFFSQTWSMILRAQAEDRAHRRGTRMPIRITDLCVMGTIDEEIRERVRGKERAAMDVADLRAILETIRKFGGGNRE